MNAAINILNEGLRNISAGTVDYTDRADVIPNIRLSAMKSESHQSLVCGFWMLNKILRKSTKNYLFLWRIFSIFVKLI